MHLRPAARRRITRGSGCPVAIERDGRIVTDLGPESVNEAGDTVVVAGADETVHAFIELSR